MSLAAIRVLLVDDHPVVRAGLAGILAQESDIEVVGQAATGQQALELLRALQPRVALVDIGLGDTDGIALVENLCRDGCTTRFGILTIYQGEDDIYRAVRAGARGYLLKDARGEELVDAVRTLANGGRFFPRGVAERLAERLAGSELTTRQLEVLRLLAGGRTNREIARRLQVREGTVKSHLSRIMEFLGVRSRSRAILAALQRGLVHGVEGRSAEPNRRGAP